MEIDFACCITPEILSVNKKYCGISGTFNNQPKCYMQTLTAEEAAIVDELSTDYTTLANGICLDIYLGRIDIETERDPRSFSR